MGHRNARGITLVELTIVSALAMLVILAMIGFYISSQSSWMAGSSQALAQRDATQLLEAISNRVRSAAHAEVDRTDPLHHTLILRDAAQADSWRFWWDGNDRRIHQGPSMHPDSDRGAVVNTPVTRFQLDTLTRLVEIQMIELQADDGRAVRISSAAALYNRRSTP